LEQKEKDILSLTRIHSIIQILLGKDGCPWDKKQTPETITRYILEESYELLDAVKNNDDANICEEVGDVLFLILFLVELMMSSGKFSFDDVIHKNTEKMISRHPHVFDQKSSHKKHMDIRNHDDVLKQWNLIKEKEKKNKKPASVLDSVPTSMTPLMRAYQVSERTANLGFDWDNMEGVLEKVEEEWNEFKEALVTGNKKDISLEFGDILFTLTNVARFAGIHPETALAGSVAKFEHRYRYMEKKLQKDNKKLDSIAREEIDLRWDEAKAKT